MNETFQVSCQSVPWESFNSILDKSSNRCHYLDLQWYLYKLVAPQFSYSTWQYPRFKVVPEFRTLNILFSMQPCIDDIISCTPVIANSKNLDKKQIRLQTQLYKMTVNGYMCWKYVGGKHRTKWCVCSENIVYWTYVESILWKVYTDIWGIVFLIKLLGNYILTVSIHLILHGTLIDCS